TGRGAAYIGKGEYDLAIADLEKAIGIDPKDAAAYSNRGLALSGKGEYELAIADFDKALTIAPDFAPAREGRKRAQFRLAALPTVAEESDACRTGPVDDRIAACTRMLKRDPENGDAYKYRGLAFDGKGVHDRAIADFD